MLRDQVGAVFFNQLDFSSAQLLGEGAEVNSTRLGIANNFATRVKQCSVDITDRIGYGKSRSIRVEITGNAVANGWFRPTFKTPISIVIDRSNRAARLPRTRLDPE